MNDDHFTLNSYDAERWDAIVNNAWPSDLGRGTMRERDADDGTDPRSVDAEAPLSMVVYLPHRPAMLPLAISTVLSGTVIWAAVNNLAPAYRLAARNGAVRSDRVEAVHQLTVTAAATAVILLLAVTCCGAWLVSLARYRLRRTSYDRVMFGAPNSTRSVRPPNPVTAATWVLLLLTGSTIAWWWIVPRLDDASSTRSDAIASLSEAVVVGLVWLALVLLCAIGLTLWTARESRNRLRHAAYCSSRKRHCS